MIINKLNELKETVTSNEIPLAKNHWGMHDIGFIDKVPKKQKCDGFYPEPEFIVTPHSKKISWLMEQLAHAWYDMEDVDNKRFEFFVPIVEAAQKSIEQNPEMSAKDICLVILGVAEKIISETIAAAACSGVVNPDGLHIYFAYGSNMNSKQMNERCPGAITLGISVLSGYKLTERKYADIDIAGDSEVYGVLYAISEEHLKELDYCEGYKLGIYDRKIVKIQFNGTQCTAITYEMTPATKHERDGISYPVDYRQRCSIGAKEHGIKDCFTL